jgi:hypothetical protein
MPKAIVSPRPVWRRILRRAKQRFHRLRLPDRPSLTSPHYLILFEPLELAALAAASHWPLTPRELAYLARPPAARCTQTTPEAITVSIAAA